MEPKLPMGAGGGTVLTAIYGISTLKCELLG
jgi:hypothetical protein